MKKAQAALEYLVTYGWGFLVILIVFGTLVYFGFLNPSKYIPATCSFGAQLECADYALRAGSGVSNGNVQLIFRNNFGDDIVIMNMTTAAGTGILTTPATFPILVTKGNISPTITFKLGDTDPVFLSQGDRADVQMIVTFQRNLVSAPQHNLTGEIFANVQ